MKYNNVTFNTEQDPVIHKMFSAVVELIPQIPALKALLDEVSHNGPVKVNFVNRNEIHTNGSCQKQGSIRGNQKRIDVTIKISNHQSFAKMFDTLIFELYNAKNPYFQLFDNLELKPAQFNDADSYARAVEYAEYAYTHLPSRQTLKEIFQNPNTLEAFRKKGLPLQVQELRQLVMDGFASFQDWWNTTNKPIQGRNYSHTDVYRQDYLRWAAQHPGHVAKGPQPFVGMIPGVQPAARSPAPVKPKENIAPAPAARNPAPAVPRAPIPPAAAAPRAPAPPAVPPRVPAPPAVPPRVPAPQAAAPKVPMRFPAQVPFKPRMNIIPQFELSRNEQEQRVPHHRHCQEHRHPHGHRHGGWLEQNRQPIVDQSNPDQAHMQRRYRGFGSKY